MSLVPPTLLNDNNGGVQKNDGNTVDEPIPNNDGPNEHVKQAPSEQPIELQLRRFTREHQPS